MNNLRRVKLGSFFTQSVAGEWGSEATGIDDVTVYRAADFSKDCKLNVTEGALRSVPKNKLSNRKLNRNDILVEKSGGSPTQPVGRAVIYKPESDEQVATCSNFLQRLVVDEEYSPEFVYYLMLGLYQANATLPYQQQTTGIYNLKLEEYLQTEVDTYVDRNLQEKVADILSTIDHQIDATQALIDKYTAIKQGMMADLFSRGIDPETKALRPTFEEAPELYHKTPLGVLPKGWLSLSLEDVAAQEKGSTVIGPFGSDLVAADYTTEGVPIVFVRDVKVDRFHWKSNTYVSHAKARALKAHSAQTGDVIVTKMGLPPCIAAVYPDSMPNGIITADIIRLRPNDALAFSDWVAIAINSNEMRKQVEAITAGVTRPKVTLKDFRQLTGRFPPKKEQKLILDRLEPIKSLIESEEAAIAKLKLQKQGLMQDLLTGKVPVPA